MIDTQTPPMTTPVPRRGPRQLLAATERLGTAIVERAAALARWVNARDLRFHTVVIGAFVVLAAYVMAKVWISPDGRLLENASDQIFFQYMFAHGEHVAFHGEYPFFTDRLNVPNGVNLMANTSILGVTVLMAPITALFGPGVSFVLFTTLALAGSAAAWYWFLLRHLRMSRTAAVVGAAFCGFGPGMVSQANSHPNLVALFVVPFIIARVLTLGRGRNIRNGVILAVLLTFQAFINEEVLFFTALACAVFVAAWAVQHRPAARARLRGSAISVLVAIAITAALLAYPLYIQFRGPQHYVGLLHGAQWSADLYSYLSLPRASFGADWSISRFAANSAEETSFFGWPLAMLVVAIIVWLRRDTTVRALVATGFVFLTLSLGVPVYLHGHIISPIGTWSVVNSWPLFTSVTPVRLGLIVTMVVGILLAFAVDRAGATGRHSVPDGAVPDRRDVTVRRFAYGLFAMALVPLFPLPHYTVVAPPVPAFITNGTWRRYINEGQTLVTVPLPLPLEPTAMRWAAAEHLDFDLAGGYFLGPIDGVAGKSARFGATPRPTDELFNKVVETGRVPVITDRDRERAAADLVYWRAGAVVLDLNQKEAAALRLTATRLFGPPKLVEGVWLWDVG